ncbi:chaperone NapD [Uliginosibacterium sp. H3]|uniref:Chaperone NapD n=1 Tax=Uliginosibacterium silvisoli TaxID=3114758 RepID=A0ABU6K0B6_9RHOO|nr:chaperone NapD [Uliginosibacterium sp. H3]
MTDALHAAELHIAGVVVHVVPLHLARTHAAMSRMEGVCIHASTPTGKIVVTLETPGEGPMMVLLGEIQQLPGVISAALVYQHADTLDAMNEELSNDYAA